MPTSTPITGSDHTRVSTQLNGDLLGWYDQSPKASSTRNGIRNGQMPGFQAEVRWASLVVFREWAWSPPAAVVDIVRFGLLDVERGGSDRTPTGVAKGAGQVSCCPSCAG
ncbi:hypothetical protein GCM10009780_28090 [Actinomadura alba]